LFQFILLIFVNLLTFLFACVSSLFQTSAVSWNRQATLPFQANASTLPLGWVDAKDPASGATYYYNQHTGTCQWERPVELSYATSSAPPVLSKEEWIETFDEASGMIFTHLVIIMTSSLLQYSYQRL
jgi:hypothetical protein